MTEIVHGLLNYVIALWEQIVIDINALFLSLYLQQ